MRYKNVEFRRAGVADSNGCAAPTLGVQNPAEIVAWMGDDWLEEEKCFTICWIKEGFEGWYIETVGDRFTEYEDIEALMHVAKYALRALNIEKDFKEKCYD